MTLVDQTGTLIQDGEYIPVFGGWLNSALITDIALRDNGAATSVGGFRFANFWSTGTPTAGTFRVRLIGVLAGEIGSVLSVYAKTGTTAVEWSNSNIPPLAAASLPPTHYLLATRTLTTAGAQDLVFTLDPVNLALAVAGWDGSVALHLHCTVAAASPMTLVRVMNLSGQLALTLDVPMMPDPMPDPEPPPPPPPPPPMDPMVPTMPTNPGTPGQSGMMNTGGTWTETGDLELRDQEPRSVAGLVFSGFTAASKITQGLLSLTLKDVSSGQVGSKVRVFAVGSPNPSPFSASNLPPSLGESVNPRHYLIGSKTILSSETGTWDLWLPLDLLGLNSAINTPARDSNGNPVEWQGTIAIHLHAVTADASLLIVEEDSAALQLTTTTRLFTGIEIEGDWDGINSRPDICPITGDEDLRQNWSWCELHRRFERTDACDEDDIRYPAGRSSRALVNED